MPCHKQQQMLKLNESPVMYFAQHKSPFLQRPVVPKIHTYVGNLTDVIKYLFRTKSCSFPETKKKWRFKTRSNETNERWGLSYSPYKCELIMQYVPAQQEIMWYWRSPAELDLGACFWLRKVHFFFDQQVVFRVSCVSVMSTQLDRWIRS